MNTSKTNENSDILCSEVDYDAAIRQLINTVDGVVHDMAYINPNHVLISSHLIQTNIEDARFVPYILSCIKGDTDSKLIEDILSPTPITMSIGEYLANVDDIASFINLINDLIKDVYTHKSHTTDGYYKIAHVRVIVSVTNILECVLKIIGEIYEQRITTQHNE